MRIAMIIAVLGAVVGVLSLPKHEVTCKDPRAAIAQAVAKKGC